MEEKDKSIKQLVFSGAIWKFSERILAQTITLMVSLILARLLEPSDYGVVSIVTIFFTFANIFIAGGLNSALIQKQNADINDYNTVFTLSFIVSILFYVSMYALAPWLASVYDQPILVKVIRVLGLSLPIYAIKSIVSAYVSANLQFKKFFFATIGGTLVSAVVGISMAISGFGVWALVAQQMTNTLIDTIMLFYITKLRLSFRISFNRLKSLIGYGSRIMLSSLLGTTITQINPLFIGLKYTSADLSFYTKGKGLPGNITDAITYTISSVLFPALAKYQDEKEKLLKYTSLYMQVSSFVIFPAMLGFFAVSDSFVRVILTDKWMPVSYYIKITCISSMFDIIAIGNCETIKAMGRSDIFLKMEIIKKSGYFVITLLFLLFTDSPEKLALSMLVITIIQIIVNSIPNGRLIGYTIKLQAKDLLPNLINGSIMCAIVTLIGKLNINSMVILIIQVISGIMIYLFLSVVSHNPSIKFGLDIVKQKINKEI